MAAQAADAQHREAQLRRRGLDAQRTHLVERSHDVARRHQHVFFDAVAAEHLDGNSLVVDAKAGARAGHDRGLVLFCRLRDQDQTDGAFAAGDDVDAGGRRLVAVFGGDH